MGQIITVEFNGDTLFAVEQDDRIFIAPKPICDSLGIDWKSQYRRMSADAILQEGMVMMTIPSVGGPQETTLLRLDLVNGWLFTIDESRVKAEAREKVLAYKRQCYQVLFDHFYGQAKAAVAPPAPDRTGVPLEERQVLLREVQEVRLIYGPEAAAEYWKKIGLPEVPEMGRRRAARPEMPPEEADWTPRPDSDLSDDDLDAYAEVIRRAKWVLEKLHVQYPGTPQTWDRAAQAFRRVRTPDDFAAWVMDNPLVYNRLRYERPDLVQALREIVPLG